MSRRIQPFLKNQQEIEIIQAQAENDLKNKPFYVRFILPAVIKMRNFIISKMPKQKMDELDKKLQAAGRPFGITAGDFLLMQLLLPIIIIFLFLVMFYPASESLGKTVFISVLAGYFVYFYLNYYLNAKAKQRMKLIEKSMPDFFDLLNVSIEAGMGIDGALKKVCNQMNSPLSSEFLSTLEDMKLGKSRRQAFINLRERVHSDFFKSVMNSIIQADQMGVGMSKVLKTQTQRIREKQRFSAKEQEMKAPVKMLIPMVLFIFPTLFIVLLGPVVVNLVMQFL